MKNRRIVAFVLGWAIISYGGWLITHTTYPALAFIFGAWGAYILEGGPSA